MENQNYYVKNLENDKLNIYTTKAYYDGLDQLQKNSISKYCLWSRTQKCWISKAKLWNCHYLIKTLSDLGFSDGGTKGEKIPFEEQVQRQKEKAEIKAEHAENRAEIANSKSQSLFKRADDMASLIPMGQPILVGHHSEKRDRNFRQKIHNTFEKAVAESDKAEYYREKVNISKRTAEGEKYSNPKYLHNKIKECEAHIRTCTRRLNGQFRIGSPVRAVSEKEEQFYKGRIAEENEKLDFFTKRMKEINPDWTPDAKQKRGRSNKI